MARQQSWDCPYPLPYSGALPGPHLLGPQGAGENLVCLCADTASQVGRGHIPGLRSSRATDLPKALPSLSLLLPQWRHKAPDHLNSRVLRPLLMCVQKHVRTKSRPCVHCGEALHGLSPGGERVLPSPPSYLPAVVALDPWVSLRGTKIRPLEEFSYCTPSSTLPSLFFPMTPNPLTSTSSQPWNNSRDCLTFQNQSLSCRG